MLPISTDDTASTLRLIESAYEIVNADLLGYGRVDQPHANGSIGVYTYHDEKQFIVVCAKGGEVGRQLALLLPKGPIRNLIPQVVSSEPGQGVGDFVKTISPESTAVSKEATRKIRGEENEFTVDGKAQGLLRMLEGAIDTRMPESFASAIKNAIKASKQSRTTKAPSFNFEARSTIYRDRIAPLLKDLLPFDEAYRIVSECRNATGMGWRLPHPGDFGYAILFRDVVQSIFREDYHDPDSLWDMPDQFLLGDFLFWSRDKPVSRSSHCAVPIAGPLYDAMVAQANGKIPKHLKQVAPHVFQDSSVCWGGLHHDVGDDPVQAIDFGPIIIGGWNQSSSYMHPRSTLTGILVSRGGFQKEFKCCSSNAAFESKKHMLKLGVKPLMPAVEAQAETKDVETPAQRVARIFDDSWTEEKDGVFNRLRPLARLYAHNQPDNWREWRAHVREAILKRFEKTAANRQDRHKTPMKVGDLVCPPCIARNNDNRFHVDDGGVLRVGRPGTNTKQLDRTCICPGCPNYSTAAFGTCTEGCVDAWKWYTSIRAGRLNYWQPELTSRCFACATPRPPESLRKDLLNLWVRAKIRNNIHDVFLTRIKEAEPTYYRDHASLSIQVVTDLSLGLDQNHFRHMYLCDACRNTKFFKED